MNADLDGRLAPPFEVTAPKVLGPVVVGGALLRAAQCRVTRLAARLIARTRPPRAGTAADGLRPAGRPAP